MLQDIIEQRVTKGNIFLLNDASQVAPLNGAVTDLNIWKRKLDLTDIR